MGRKPFLDNTKLILIGIVALIAALAGLLYLAGRSSAVAPDVLGEFVLYALSATNLTMLLALLFVLARNIIKLVVEQRRAIPFARFRTRLVTALLGMTLIPALLVLIVGSELIRKNIDQFFNAPMANMLSSARDIASDYYGERQRVVSSVAQRLARRLSSVDVGGDAAAARDIVAADVAQERIDLVEIYRVGPRGQVEAPVVDVAAPVVPRGYSRGGADAPGAAGGADRPRRRSGRAAAIAQRWRSGSHRGADPLVAGRTRARRADRQRIPDGRVRVARAQPDRRVRGLPAARGSETGAGHGLPLLLSDADADDSGRPRPGWVSTWRSGSRGRCRCWPRPPTKSVPATSITASTSRWATNSPR